MKLHLRADLAFYLSLGAIAFLVATIGKPFVDGFRGAILSSTHQVLTYAAYTRFLARSEALAPATVLVEQPAGVLAELEMTPRELAKLRLTNLDSPHRPLWANTSGEHAR